MMRWTRARRAAEQVVCADDIRLKDRLPAALARDTSQMYDAVDISDDAFDCGKLGKLGVFDLLSGSRCRERDMIGEPQDRIDALQSLAQRAADAPAGTRNQHSMHPIPPVLSNPLPGSGSCHAE